MLIWQYLAVWRPQPRFLEAVDSQETHGSRRVYWYLIEAVEAQCGDHGGRGRV
jgi:hypothetical protein